MYRSVEWFGGSGLANHRLVGIESIGIHEMHWGKGQRSANFLTVIYQMDRGARRLIWVGPRRTKAALRQGLTVLGPQLVGGLRFVCSDMWKPYLTVIAKMAGHALHVVGRSHVGMNLNHAVDQVRRAESARVRGQPIAARLKKLRWQLLRRGSRVRGRARIKLRALVASKLATGGAWSLKEAFQHFWSYRSVHWAGGFLDYWCERAMRSRLEPMKKIARMLRSHEELLLNWFRARGEISSGAVEGLNKKVRVVTRRSYGFGPTKAWNSPFVTTSHAYPSLRSPTNSADEVLLEVGRGNTQSPPPTFARFRTAARYSYCLDSSFARKYHLWHLKRPPQNGLFLRGFRRRQQRTTASRR